MKVLLISTSEQTGGGAIAAKRLLHALRSEGTDAKMLVRDKSSDEPSVVSYGNVFPKIRERLRLMYMMRCSLHKTWEYDLMTDGIDILSTKEYKEADIIHLHWVNQGMLSIKQLTSIANSGKKVFWTLHDEWPYLGFAHYEREDDRYHAIGTDRREYMTRSVPYNKIHFIGCSKWITDRAQKALPTADVTHINNCVPQQLFHPISQQEARKALNLPMDKHLVLFCAQNINDERKGYRYLQDALRQMPSIETLIIGQGGHSMSQDELPLAYSAADVFVTPSLCDNLPNTIAESLSCGTPCVAFNVGGIPEMIQHGINGYLATPRSTDDLAYGIRDTLLHPEYRKAAAESARHLFSPQNVAAAHLALYRK